MTKEEAKEMLRMDRNAIRTTAGKQAIFPEFKAETKRRHMTVIMALRDGIKMWMKKHGYSVNANLFPDFRAATVTEGQKRGGLLTEQVALGECMNMWLDKYVRKTG